ncbi:MAG: hypothetical protein AAF335_01870, partial [Bacteroidota bacterium]
MKNKYFALLSSLSIVLSTSSTQMSIQGSDGLPPKRSISLSKKIRNKVVVTAIVAFVGIIAIGGHSNLHSFFKSKKTNGKKIPVNLQEASQKSLSIAQGVLSRRHPDEMTIEEIAYFKQLFMQANLKDFDTLHTIYQRIIDHINNKEEDRKTIVERYRTLFQEKAKEIIHKGKSIYSILEELVKYAYIRPYANCNKNASKVFLEEVSKYIKNDIFTDEKLDEIISDYSNYMDSKVYKMSTYTLYAIEDTTEKL